MTKLEEAWRWYESTRAQLRRMQRLAEHYWDEMPWAGRLERANHFQHLEAAAVAGEAAFSLSHLDDLAVVVLFSVFESLVRHQVAQEVKQDSLAIRHRALRAAAEEALERIEEGSFFHVLEPFKDVDANLVEEVNQVRRYRNWVAHGKRGQGPDSVTPRVAFDRLQRFLQLMHEHGPGGAERP
jgi:hypothetical protein